MDIEKIKSFYKITVDKFDKDTLMIGDKHISPTNQKPLIFTFGNKSITTIELAKADNNCIVTTNKDFYLAYYNLNESEFRLKYEHIDERTYNYITACKTNIGLTEYNGTDKKAYDNWESLKLENSFTLIYQGFYKTEIEVGQIDNIWCSQYSVQTEVDDYCIVKYFFTKKPTLTAITTAQLLSTIELEFFLNRISFKNNCWECGCEFHWLDTEGSLSEKYDNLKEKYCGC